MIAAWLDTNVIVRFLANEPPAMARRAERLLARALTTRRRAPRTGAELLLRYGRAM